MSLLGVRHLYPGGKLGRDLFSDRKETLMENYVGVTTDAHGGPTKAPQPKVVAATAGSLIGGAVSTITLYLIESLGGVTLPDEVKSAAVVLISAGVAFLAGYVKKPTGVS